MNDVIHGPSLLTEYDIHLFREGKHFRLYEKLGAQLQRRDKGIEGQRDAVEDTGILFAVWAPNAKAVSVVGDFNDWNPNTHRLAVRWDSSGIWEGFIPQTNADCRMNGTRYKFHITARDGMEFDKADPFARFAEMPPNTASVMWNPHYVWQDGDWLARRARTDAHQEPLSIYELHPG
ncbi:1,4-alpha-glucan branching enzyme, partial [candidate division WOR-3 bacterium]|nr:1,4-alpha-glucan branching enzyme [candidate division WOR-3 bacterium]